MMKLLLSLSLLTPMIPSPPVIGLMLMLFTATVTLTILLIYSTWVSMMMFIIYLGGLMVMFSYFMSISPNLPILSPATTSFSTTLVFLSMLNPSTQKSNVLMSSAQLSEIMSSNLSEMMLLLLYVLFLMLIIVVLMTKYTGSLRSFK